MGQFLVNRSHTASAAVEEQSANLASGAAKPDIYYIILDGYSRDDTLQDFFDYDNSQFLKALEDMGFYVARCSQSNYAQTQLSSRPPPTWTTCNPSTRSTPTRRIPAAPPCRA